MEIIDILQRTINLISIYTDSSIYVKIIKMVIFFQIFGMSILFASVCSKNSY